MDNSGSMRTNTNDMKSPFAPADLPDLNNIATQGAMPPMNNAMTANDRNSAEGAAQSVVSSTQAMTALQNVQQNAQMPAKPQVEQVARQAQQPEKAAELTMADIPAPKMMSEKEAKKADINTTEAKAGVAQSSAKPVEQKASPVQNVTVAANDLAQVSETTNGVTIEPLLEECIRQNASDLHLQVGLPPVLRVDGSLRSLSTYGILDDATVQRLVFSTLDSEQKIILLKDKEFDYSFAYGDLGRFRVNAFHEKGNMAGAFRLIPNVITNINDLGLPQVVSTFADHPNGLVLVTGPTGSGKSTTLAALIDKINTERAEHIITIEDPIEFTHQSKRSVVAQREVHYDTFSFAAALRSILREDPDVVLIGEMRDLETIQAAITVAETGHLVFATLHTNSAAQSIDRMIDVFPAHQQPQVRSQLANILVGICSQRVVPALAGGRVAVTEIMITNSAVRSIIREGKTHQLDMTIQTGMSQGMQTMDRELAKFVRAGTISYDVARGYAVDVAEFDRLARG